MLLDLDDIKTLVGEFFNGQYEVKKFLGEGSFAKVYLVKHNYLEDLRAMKIIKEPVSPATNIKSVFKEVMLATKLRHENIISIYDAGIMSTFGQNKKDLAFFVMEYVQGGDLEQYLNSFIKILDDVKNYLEEKGKFNYLKDENVPVLSNGEETILSLDLLKEFKENVDKMDLKKCDVFIEEVKGNNYGMHINESLTKLIQAYEMFDFHTVKLECTNLLSFMIDK